MQKDPTERLHIENRTLETLSADLERFHHNGNNIKRAKFFNNVIDDRLFDVPLDQV